MPQHPCPRCKTLIPVGVHYCEACRPIMERRHEQAKQRKAEQYNKRRDPKYLKFYRSKEWRITSKTKLVQVSYQCEAGLEGCRHIATEVHHIKPIQTPEGWERRLDFDNLEAVCVSCHNKRHNRFNKPKKDGVIDIRAVKGSL